MDGRIEWLHDKMMKRTGRAGKMESFIESQSVRCVCVCGGGGGGSADPPLLLDSSAPMHEGVAVKGCGV